MLRPDDAQQLADLVQNAAGTGTPVWTTAGDSKWDLGSRVGHVQETPPEQVSLAALTGIVSYEPGELVLAVGAATPLTQIEALLAAEGQHLAFEPVHWRSTATAGGTVATALAGPRRFRSGGVRDFVLGLQFVDGQGRLVRSGGRVVKNVSGYDLWRGLTGSFGTLGLITEICFKLWPRPQAEQTLLIEAPGLSDARQRMLELAGRQEEITGLAFVPEQGVLARLEGNQVAVQRQVDAVARDVTVKSRLDDQASAAAWSGLREAEALRDDTGELWRFVIPAGHWVALLGDLFKAGVERYHVDWGGGLLWALVPSDAALAHGFGGHALAQRHHGLAWRVATGTADDNAAGMPPLEDGLARLNRRLQGACDPHGILNPGRIGL